MSSTLTLHRLPDRYAVCRLDRSLPVPDWAIEETMAGAMTSLLSITKTAGELSIIVTETAVPGDVTAARGYVGFMVNGPLPFSMVGVLASLAGALAEAEVPLLAVSTYDTDILLVKAEHAAAAEAALVTVAQIG